MSTVVNGYYPLSTQQKANETTAASAASTPRSIFLQPVMTNFTEFAAIGGHFSTVVTWEIFFHNILPPSASGVVVILSDSCGSAYTYEINGKEATYLGEGDLHDPIFNDMAYEGTLVDETRTVDICTYVMFVYPTSTFHDQYKTNNPIIYTLVVVIIVLCTALFFVMYDWYSKRKEQMLLMKAERTHAIVASLFPGHVARQLISDGASKEDDNDRKTTGGRAGLRRYLADGDEDVNALDLNSKPIADLFPHTTVMFCDIVGFTAWSSIREPAQIFTLLEAIFSTFDNVAKKRGVFKVETVGDCYVAVAGLPVPRDDHAVGTYDISVAIAHLEDSAHIGYGNFFALLAVMARFARECRTRVKALLPKLEVTLGPDTGELAMRFGLHSGPVTAGVLRGEKARYVLTSNCKQFLFIVYLLVRLLTFDVRCCPFPVFTASSCSVTQ